MLEPNGLADLIFTVSADLSAQCQTYGKVYARFPKYHAAGKEAAASSSLMRYANIVIALFHACICVSLSLDLHFHHVFSAAEVGQPGALISEGNDLFISAVSVIHSASCDLRGSVEFPSYNS